MAPIRKITCLKCKRIAPPAGRGMCAKCLAADRADHDRSRIGTRERSHYGPEYQRERNRAIGAHVAIHGYVCTMPDHRGDRLVQPRDLTTDHVKPRSLEQGLKVMCRSCNARKGART